METTARAPKTHDLKEHPGPFAELAHRRRNVELRINDRDYQNGDKLVIREFDPRLGRYTNAFVTCYVRCIVSAKDWGGMFEGLLDPRVVALGIEFPEERGARTRPTAAVGAEVRR